MVRGKGSTFVFIRPAAWGVGRREVRLPPGAPGSRPTLSPRGRSIASPGAIEPTHYFGWNNSGAVFEIVIINHHRTRPG